MKLGGSWAEILSRWSAPVPVLALLVPIAMAQAPTANEQHNQITPEHVIMIAMEKPYYLPDPLVIRAGETVRWVNPPNSELHGVRELATGAFDARLNPGESWSYRFDRPGEYDYGCRYHPWMRGHITVLP